MPRPARKSCTAGGHIPTRAPQALWDRDDPCLDLPNSRSGRKTAPTQEKNTPTRPANIPPNAEIIRSRATNDPINQKITPTNHKIDPPPPDIIPTWHKTTPLTSENIPPPAKIVPTNAQRPRPPRENIPLIRAEKHPFQAQPELRTGNAARDTRTSKKGDSEAGGSLGFCAGKYPSKRLSPFAVLCASCGQLGFSPSRPISPAWPEHTPIKSQKKN